MPCTEYLSTRTVAGQTMTNLQGLDDVSEGYDDLLQSSVDLEAPGDDLEFDLHGE